MVRLPSRIGTKGSAQAIFFHISQDIREKWPNDHGTKQVLGFFPVGNETHRVNQKDQLCYECRIPKIDNGTVFHICCGKFNIEEAPSILFKDEIVVKIVVAATQDPDREQTTLLRESVADVAPNVNGGILQ